MRNRENVENGRRVKREKRGESMSNESAKVFIVWKEK